jgi:formylglycine-generating enzyme required for sulfatase activity
MEMIYVPAGQFAMGSSQEDVDRAFEQCGVQYDHCTREGYELEQPPHTVEPDGFWIDRTEVTNAQYAAFLNRQGNQQEGGTPWLDLDEGCLIQEVGGEYRAVPGYADHPVVCVSWYGAVAYSRSVGGRLPTEAEWEYAARGPQSLRYPWGEAFDSSKVNFCDVNCAHDFRATEYDDGYGTTAPVGSYPGGASWSGAVDMAGNVWEWTQTRFDGYPYDASDGREELSPVGKRTLRGGSFTNLIPNVRGAYRAGLPPDNKVPSLGFRVVVPSEGSN